MQTDDPLLSLDEIREILGYRTVSSVSKLIRSGKLKGVNLNVGGHYAKFKVRQSVLDEFLAANVTVAEGRPRRKKRPKAKPPREMTHSRSL